MRSVLAEVVRLPEASVLALGPLGEQAVHELLRSLAVPPEPDRARSIAARSEGIPFFAVHLAEHAGGSSVPATLHDVLSATLAAVGPEQRRLLVLLAVRGDGEDLPPVGTGEDDQVRDLVGRGILAVRDGRVVFRHALLREVVVDDTLPSERVLAHARMADLLLGTPSTHVAARSGRLAHHLLECGRYDEAIRYAVQAARTAASTWAFREARDLLAAVRRLWPLVASPGSAAGASAVTLLTEAATASRWCGDLDGALALLDEAGREDDVPAAELASVEHARGQVLWAAGRMAESAQAYARAVEMLPAGDDEVLRCRLLAALAQGLMATGRARDARETASRAADLAAGPGVERVRLHAAVTASVADAQLGDVDGALEGLRACLPQARRLDDAELVVRVYGNLAFALGIGCRYEELAEITAEGIEVCGRYGPVLSIASTLVTNQVNALVALGRWDEAQQVAGSASEAVTSETVAEQLRLAVAEVALARGDLGTVRACLSLSEQAGVDHPYAASSAALLRAGLLLVEGDPAAARDQVAGALQALLDQDDVLPLLEACWLGLRASADVREASVPSRRSDGRSEADGDGDGGTVAPAALLARAHEAAGRTASPAAAPMLLACVAESARARGDDDVDAWQAAASADAALGRPYLRAYCLLRLGACHLHRRARAAAEEPLREALRLAEELGAAPLARDVEVLLRVAGLDRRPAAPERTATPAPASPFGLTARELEVARLLTTGATNRVIARTLFVTERTASVHVSNILAKLGVANRTEAARKALAAGLDAPAGPQDTA